MDNRSAISAYSIDPRAEGGYYPCPQIAMISLGAKSLTLTIKWEAERVIRRLLRVNLSCGVIIEGGIPFLARKYYYVHAKLY